MCDLVTQKMIVKVECVLSECYSHTVLETLDPTRDATFVF